ncbi:MAG: hypothetical protein D6732_27325 [Methanobacteriota archaeon]|nr:MAG: hypothetical protein D6732_27325 [Euryarchaeota archaeon]
MKEANFFFKWSVKFSVTIIILSVVIFAFNLPLTFFAIVAITGFAFLIKLGSGHWTPNGKFGWANTITAMKLTLLIITIILLDLQIIDPVIVGFVLVGLVFIDKADGIMARYLGEVSIFGEIFDNEVDAFSTLVATIILSQIDTHYLVFIIVGLLRYLYVLGIWLFDPPVKKEKASFINKILGVSITFSFAFLIIFQTTIFLIITSISSVAIFWSFAKDFYWILGTARKSQ